MKADPNCRYCHGRGIVEDWVPYGSGDIPMPSQCDCVSIPECPNCGSDNTRLEYINVYAENEEWYCEDCDQSFRLDG